MRWPFSSGDARAGSEPARVAAPASAGELARPAPWSAGATTEQPSPALRSAPGRETGPGLPVDAIVAALATGSSRPSRVGVLCEDLRAGAAGRGRGWSTGHPDGSADAVLIGRLAEQLPVDRLVTVPSGAGPVDVRELDEWATRLGGVDALVAIGTERTVDAARVLAAGGRNLAELYGGRGGSQCLLPLAGAIPLVAVPRSGFDGQAAGSVVVGTDVGRLVLTGDVLAARHRFPLPDAGADIDRIRAATRALVGRFLGPWHGAGLPAPQRAVHDVRALLAGALELSLDPAKAQVNGTVDRLAELARRAGRVCGPPGRPCSWWLWPLAHEWATITDRSWEEALADLLPAWSAELAALGIPDEQRGLWHEAAISDRSTSVISTLTAGDLRIVLQRVDRWWRPIGPGIPEDDEVHRIFGLRRRPIG